MRHRQSDCGQDPAGQDRALDALLAGVALPVADLGGADQPGLQPVADVLAALRRPGERGELAGQASALAEFRARPRRRARATARHRRGPVLSTLLRPRPATAVAAGALLLAGLAAGAYAGDLPAPVQGWAHRIGLTAVRSPATPTPTPTASRRAGQPAAAPTREPSHRARDRHGRGGRHATARPGWPRAHHPRPRRPGRPGVLPGRRGGWPAPGSRLARRRVPGGQVPGAGFQPTVGPAATPPVSGRDPLSG
ncbi:MAG TPA: hypothetical protein VMH35_17010 [Streptosporangiaceae bacterium]|nr:hypothetical protein [Streptosporangiaceae bacterium]